MLLEAHVFEPPPGGRFRAPKGVIFNAAVKSIAPAVISFHPTEVGCALESTLGGCFAHRLMTELGVGHGFAASCPDPKSFVAPDLGLCSDGIAEFTCTDDSEISRISVHRSLPKVDTVPFECPPLPAPSCGPHVGDDFGGRGTGELGH